MLSIFVWVDLEYLADAAVVVPLLEKFLLVCGRVTFYEILKLRKIGCEEYAATHGEGG